MHVTVVLPQRCDAAVEFVVHPFGQILRPGADSEHRQVAQACLTHGMVYDIPVFIRYVDRQRNPPLLSGFPAAPFCQVFQGSEVRRLV